MTHLLDTNICIDHLRPETQQAILSRINSVGVANVAVCAVVRAVRAARPAGAMKSDRPVVQRAKVKRFVSAFESLPFDDAAAEHYSAIRVQLETRPDDRANDLLIASIALAHDAGDAQYGRVHASARAYSGRPARTVLTAAS